MTKPAAFLQADLTRALRGVIAADVAVSRIELEPGGKIVIIAADGSPIRFGPANPCDKDLEP